MNELEVFFQISFIV